MYLLNCCKKMLHKFSSKQRSVLCKNWIKPLQITTILSLFLHIGRRAFHPASFYTIPLVLIHCAIVLLILAECRRSSEYHKTVESFNRRETSFNDEHY